MKEESHEDDGYITLKEAARLSGYTPDYIGQLIRKGKIHGRQVYTNIAWVTTEEAIKKYLEGDSEKTEKSDKQLPSTFRLNKRIEHFLDKETSQGFIKWILYAVLAVSLFATVFVLYAWMQTLDDIAHRGEPRLSMQRASMN